MEVNSFANLFPFQEVSIKSLVFDFLVTTGNNSYIEQYGLTPFPINVLNKEQTFIEKLVSLIRFSYDKDAIESLSGKIRHFYDIYFLANDPDVKSFLSSDAFREQFKSTLEHDQNIFDTPVHWQEKSVSDSPLVNNFDDMWLKLKSKYQTELSAYAYRPIPEEDKVARVFKRVLQAEQFNNPFILSDNEKLIKSQIETAKISRKSWNVSLAHKVVD